MSRLRYVASEHELDVMVAADSFELIADRFRLMLNAGRTMVLSVNEFTYLHRPPKLYAGLQLATEGHGAGCRISLKDGHARCDATLAAGTAYEDRIWFGFSESVYACSGNQTESEAWKRYREHEAVHSSHRMRRRDMTLVQFVGGIVGRRYTRQDSIAISSWNSDGVCTERTLGFVYTDESW